MHSDQIKSDFTKAMNLKRRGDLDDAIEMLCRLVRRRPESAKLRCALGGAYWDKELMDEAIVEFTEAIRLAPDLEIASRGLFHCHMDRGETDLAFEEMKRFMSISDSEDYRAIVKGINESD